MHQSIKLRKSAKSIVTMPPNWMFIYNELQCLNRPEIEEDFSETDSAISDMEIDFQQLQDHDIEEDLGVEGVPAAVDPVEWFNVIVEYNEEHVYYDEHHRQENIDEEEDIIHVEAIEEEVVNDNVNNEIYEEANNIDANGNNGNNHNASNDEYRELV